MSAEAIAVREIDIEKEDKTSTNVLADEFFYNCNFCEKSVVLNSIHADLYDKLVLSNEFYCANCIRNGFHTKRRKDILQLTFRAIFGYIYIKEYKSKSLKDQTIYLSELQDYIDRHVQVGLLNPAFSYDPETYLWFIDFSKVGDGKRKIEVVEICKTIVNILSCFNIYNSIPGAQMHKLYDKYNEAVILFMEKRQRPDKKRLLVPTLLGCGGTVETTFDYSETRNFFPQNLILKTSY